VKKLLLISAPVLHGEGWWANRIANKPHLASLAGVVRDLVEVETLELDRVAGAPFVAISCWTSLHYLGTIAVARIVRERFPDVPIVIGGHHATAMPADFDRESCDFLVRGDGENPLRRLCQEPPARPDAMQILDGGVFDQSSPEHIDWTQYGKKGDRAVWIGASRGCAFRCHFCVEPERGASYSRYSVEATIDILARLVETRAPKVIAFSDPLFGSNRRWLEAFLDGIEKRKLPLMFWCETRLDLMTPELLEQFKRCRFTVDFGLDTASETMAARMEKAALPKLYLERAREMLGHANAIGLFHGIYIVFNFPGETPETMRETQSFIEGLSASKMAGWLACQTFFILPGTPSWQRRDRYAELYGTEIRVPDWWKRPGDHYSMATSVLPSAAWRGRESELVAFRHWNLQINAAWSMKYTREVNMFRVSYFAG
jgi:radical SAM superfamily enzyme YgiQ (UPF0313 family)